MYNSCDPCDFTNRTATILYGLGAPELIPECKKRNISTSVLHELSVQELVMLGSDPEKAEELQKSLNIKKRKSAIVKTNADDRLEQFLEIFKKGTQQLSVLEAYLAYCRLRLEKQYIDAIIDSEKYVNASHVFPLCIDATLTEIREVKRSLSELEKLFGSEVKKSRFISITKSCVFLGAVGLVLFVSIKMNVV